MKAGSSTQPLHAHTLPPSAPTTLTPAAARTQVAPAAGVRVAPAAAARPTGPRKSNTGLILGLLAAGLIFVLGIGGVGAYFLFLKPKPDQGGSQTAGGAADSQTGSGPSLSAPPLTVPPMSAPVTAPPGSTPPLTAPSGTTPVTTPDTGSRRADDSTGSLHPPLPPPMRDAVPPAEDPDLSVLDRQPPLDERPISERVGPYGRSGSGYGAARGQLRRRERFPGDTSPRERPAIWALLNLVNRQEAYRAKNGRYGSFAETLHATGMGTHSFARHGYRFELTTDADSFKIVATPLAPGLRPLVVDDSGIVGYAGE